MTALVLRDRKGKTIGVTNVPAESLRLIDTYDGITIVAKHDLEIETFHRGKAPFTLTLAGVPIPTSNFPAVVSRGMCIHVVGIRLDVT